MRRSCSSVVLSHMILGAIQCCALGILFWKVGLWFDFFMCFTVFLRSFFRCFIGSFLCSDKASQGKAEPIKVITIMTNSCYAYQLFSFLEYGFVSSAFWCRANCLRLTVSVLNFHTFNIVIISIYCNFCDLDVFESYWLRKICSISYFRWTFTFFIGDVDVVNTNWAFMPLNFAESHTLSSLSAF